MSTMSAVGTTDAPPAEARSALGGRLGTDGGAVLGLAIVVFFTLVAILAPVIVLVSGHNPYDYDLAALTSTGAPAGRLGGVSADHWFGVEPLTGRDLFAIVVYGARTSMLVGVLAT